MLLQQIGYMQVKMAEEAQVPPPDHSTLAGIGLGTVGGLGGLGAGSALLGKSAPLFERFAMPSLGGAILPLSLGVLGATAGSRLGKALTARHDPRSFGERLNQGDYETASDPGHKSLAEKAVTPFGTIGGMIGGGVAGEYGGELIDKLLHNRGITKELGLGGAMLGGLGGVIGGGILGHNMGHKLVDHYGMGAHPAPPLHVPEKSLMDKIKGGAGDIRNKVNNLISSDKAE